MLSELLSVINLFLVRQLIVSKVFIIIFDAELKSRWTVRDRQNIELCL